MMNVNEAYANCKAVIDRHSSTFSAAFAHLPTADRRAIWAVYAFCRHVDDLVDEGEDTLEERRAQLAVFAAEFEAMRKGTIPDTLPLWTALADVFRRYNMQIRPFEEMIAGQQLDLAFRQPTTLQELETYCYHVAGTVGLMLLPILYPDAPDAVARQSVSLGIAMQFTNILRDVSEDAARGRVYLPADLMSMNDVAQEDIEHGRPTPGWRKLANTLADRAETLYAQGLAGAEAFPPASRISVVAAGRMYKGILDKVRASEFHVFGQRHHLNDTERTRLIFELRHSAMYDASDVTQLHRFLECEQA